MLYRKVAHVCNLDCVVVGFRKLGKEQAHFLLGLEVPVVQVHVAAHLLVGLVEQILKADAAKRVLRLRVFLFHIVNVVGDDHRYVQVARHFYQALGDDFLLGDSVVLQFDVKMVGAKKFLVLASDLVGLFRPAGEKVLGNLALDAGRKANEAFVPFLEHLKVDAGLSVIQGVFVAKGAA